jgi:hypothetical protein
LHWGCVWVTGDISLVVVLLGKTISLRISNHAQTLTSSSVNTVVPATPPCRFLANLIDCLIDVGACFGCAELADWFAGFSANGSLGFSAGMGLLVDGRLDDSSVKG